MLSLIIPIHNDARRLLSWWGKLKSSLKGMKYEIILAEDGSTDNSYEICKKLTGRNVKLSHHKEKLGKGLGIRLAAEISIGDIIGYLDADGATDPKHIKEAVEYLKDYDIVIGSRYLEKSDRKLYRKLPSVVYNFLARSILGTRARDHQCGFKFFRRRVFEEISKESTMNHWSWDTEILYIAKLKGFRVKEIPVCWVEKSGTKVRAKDVVTMAKNLLLIRARH